MNSLFMNPLIGKLILGLTLILGAHNSLAAEKISWKKNDENRDRKIVSRVFAPESSGKYPIVFISHGMLGSKNDMTYLGKYLAEHGFIVVHASHPGSRTSDPIASFENVFSPEYWKIRPGDISFLIDQLNDLESVLQSKLGIDITIDRNRIGMTGHSFGGYTTLALAGAQVDQSADRQNQNFGDSRIKAFIAMSPAGKGSYGFSEDAFTKITRPLFVMTGTKDREIQHSGDYKSRLDSFYDSPVGDKYALVLNGVGHAPFSYPAFNPRLKNWIKGTVREFQLRFWQAYLNDDPHSMEWLQDQQTTSYHEYLKR